ncbi:putative protein OS=Tsukamurella paurometabola (strain ATCC 8368 / DSM / CCUG 35730 /CIP 100753 / JCM 10117 / KCTC 9821 / NBRC 16120 / NCIMB 702349/ NCTC 13040) OX=521096 GN=Tpau_4062 PE=4 SV=1 [Tsukamurella paurometabola]|uniref:Uncharacterized protein n=1 Tax=Tsukamurella paurometabola (strain ATCC 8368 / DSM 20162 / CCUG 35730 / CIP 100753 / JCM 10117 / KCTC 9821 / NBRC 16120 / NCIMB 702349 / NCTC 13040) TaxID=521096 RepID=D5UND7_TSUPD|nr:hypothetical protein Tpau_4062 [Tsukamurella paurometabola DSM 20162]SUP40359.1 Uncharacterised protein [Tsukamurella paurometabola]
MTTKTKKPPLHRRRWPWIVGGLFVLITIPGFL